MAEHQRKIELQSPEDLTYLIDNVRRAANERIDKDLPPIEGEDHMRTQVEELVHGYVSKTFEFASDNITINGLAPPPTLLSAALKPDAFPGAVIEEHEPFNATLFERAKNLARQEEELIEEIAALRRKMPKKAVDNAKKVYKEGIDEDDKALRDLFAQMQDMQEADPGIEMGDVDEEGFAQGTWGNGIAGLERVKRTLPETVAKKERAERAENYVNGQGRRI